MRDFEQQSDSKAAPQEFLRQLVIPAMEKVPFTLAVQEETVAEGRSEDRAFLCGDQQPAAKDQNAEKEKAKQAEMSQLLQLQRGGKLDSLEMLILSELDRLNQKVRAENKTAEEHNAKPENKDKQKGLKDEIDPAKVKAELAIIRLTVKVQDAEAQVNATRDEKKRLEDQLKDKDKPPANPKELQRQISLMDKRLADLEKVLSEGKKDLEKGLRDHNANLDPNSQCRALRNAYNLLAERIAPEFNQSLKRLVVFGVEFPEHETEARVPLGISGFRITNQHYRQLILHDHPSVQLTLPQCDGKRQAVPSDDMLSRLFAAKVAIDLNDRLLRKEKLYTVYKDNQDEIRKYDYNKKIKDDWLPPDPEKMDIREVQKRNAAAADYMTTISRLQDAAEMLDRFHIMTREAYDIGQSKFFGMSSDSWPSGAWQWFVGVFNSMPDRCVIPNDLITANPDLLEIVTRLKRTINGSKLLSEQELTIGKTGAIKCDKEGIADEHAQIKMDEKGNVFIKDLGSEKGTFIDGKRIDANQWVAVPDGAKVTLGKDIETLNISGKEPGNRFIKVKLPETLERNSETDAHMKRLDELAAQIEEVCKPLLTQMQQADKNQAFHLLWAVVPCKYWKVDNEGKPRPMNWIQGVYLEDEKEYTVGRGAGKENEKKIQFDREGVAEEHAKVKFEGHDKMWIKDLGTDAGTYVNGKKIKADEWVRIYPGDKVRLGEKDVALLDNGANEINQMNFGYDTMKVQRKDPKTGQMREYTKVISEVYYQYAGALTYDGLGMDHWGGLRTYSVERAGGTVENQVLQENKELTIGAKGDVKFAREGVADTHARIKLDNEGKIWIKDLDSGKGTYINGEKIKANEWVLVKEGDKVKLGENKDGLLNITQERLFGDKDFALCYKSDGGKLTPHFLTGDKLEPWRCKQRNLRIASVTADVLIDLVMIFGGVAEMRAAWVAAEKAGATLAGCIIKTMLSRGALHFGLGTVGLAKQWIQNDWGTAGEVVLTARHFLMMADMAYTVFTWKKGIEVGKVLNESCRLAAKDLKFWKFVMSDTARMLNYITHEWRWAKVGHTVLLGYFICHDLSHKVPMMADPGEHKRTREAYSDLKGWARRFKGQPAELRQPTPFDKQAEWRIDAFRTETDRVLALPHKDGKPHADHIALADKCVGILKQDMANKKYTEDGVAAAIALLKLHAEEGKKLPDKLGHGEKTIETKDVVQYLDKQRILLGRNVIDGYATNFKSLAPERIHEQIEGLRKTAQDALNAEKDEERKRHLDKIVETYKANAEIVQKLKKAQTDLRETQGSLRAQRILLEELENSKADNDRDKDDCKKKIKELEEQEAERKKALEAVKAEVGDKLDDAKVLATYAAQILLFNRRTDNDGTPFKDLGGDKTVPAKDVIQFLQDMAAKRCGEQVNPGVVRLQAGDMLLRLHLEDFTPFNFTSICLDILKDKNSPADLQVQALYDRNGMRLTDMYELLKYVLEPELGNSPDPAKNTREIGGSFGRDSDAVKKMLKELAADPERDDRVRVLAAYGGYINESPNKTDRHRLQVDLHKLWPDCSEKLKDRAKLEAKACEDLLDRLKSTFDKTRVVTLEELKAHNRMAENTKPARGQEVKIKLPGRDTADEGWVVAEEIAPGKYKVVLLEPLKGMPIDQAEARRSEMLQAAVALADMTAKEAKDDKSPIREALLAPSLRENINAVLYDCFIVDNPGLNLEALPHVVKHWDRFTAEQQESLRRRAVAILEHRHFDVTDENKIVELKQAIDKAEAELEAAKNTLAMKALGALAPVPQGAAIGPVVGNLAPLAVDDGKTEDTVAKLEIKIAELQLALLKARTDRKELKIAVCNDLKTLLDGSDSLLYKRAVTALKGIASRAEGNDKLYSSNYFSLRTAAVKAIGRLGSNDSIAMLETILREDVVAPVRLAALEALVSLKAPGLRKLVLERLGAEPMSSVRAIELTEAINFRPTGGKPVQGLPGDVLILEQVGDKKQFRVIPKDDFVKAFVEKGVDPGKPVELPKAAQGNIGKVLDAMQADKDPAGKVFVYRSEEHPKITRRLREIEYFERRPDSTSREYRDAFHKAKRDLVYQAHHSLAGSVAYLQKNFELLYGPTLWLKVCEQHSKDYGNWGFNLKAIKGVVWDGEKGIDKHHEELQKQWKGKMEGEFDRLANRAKTDPEAFKAIVYIALSNGRPFLEGDRAWAVKYACKKLRSICEAGGPDKAKDYIWAMEMCLMHQPMMPAKARLDILKGFEALKPEGDPDGLNKDGPLAITREQASVAAAASLQRSLKNTPQDPNHPEFADQVELQCALIKFLGRPEFRNRQVMPILEAIFRPEEVDGKKLPVHPSDKVRKEAEDLYKTLESSIEVLRIHSKYDPKKTEAHLAEDLRRVYETPRMNVQEACMLILSAFDNRPITRAEDPRRKYAHELANSTDDELKYFIGAELLKSKIAEDKLLGAKLIADVARCAPNAVHRSEAEALIRTVKDGKRGYDAEDGKLLDQALKDAPKDLRKPAERPRPKSDQKLDMGIDYQDEYEISRDDLKYTSMKMAEMEKYSGDDCWFTAEKNKGKFDMIHCKQLFAASMDNVKANFPGFWEWCFTKSETIKDRIEKGRKEIWNKRWTQLEALGVQARREDNDGHEARQALAYIILTQGLPYREVDRGEAVKEAAYQYYRLCQSARAGRDDLAWVLKACLIDEPLVDRDARHSLLCGLTYLVPGSIDKKQAAIIVASALETEYQSMPKKGEPGYEDSIKLQKKMMDILLEYRHRIGDPVLSAVEKFHESDEMRAYAKKIRRSMRDSVWRARVDVEPDLAADRQKAADRAHAAIYPKTPQGRRIDPKLCDEEKAITAIFAGLRGNYDKPKLIEEPEGKADPYLAVLRPAADRHPNLRVRLACCMALLEGSPRPSDFQTVVRTLSWLRKNASKATQDGEERGIGDEAGELLDILKLAAKDKKDFLQKMEEWEKEGAEMKDAA